MVARLLAAALLCLSLAGCATTPPASMDAPPPASVEHRVRLVELTATGNGTIVTAEGDGVAWTADSKQAAIPRQADPADYGARPDGAYWQDSIIQAKSYTLDAGAMITTHTHGLVIYATESITVNGRIDARNIGAQPNTPGYSSTRAATMNLYRAYGETDEATGEPLLWGGGSQTDECVSPGGGYVILNAPQIILNGDVDAGSDCGQAGIVYLEGNVSGAGVVTASLIIHRGTTQ